MRFKANHRQNRLNWARSHSLNTVTPTVVFLNEIASGVGVSVIVWIAIVHGYRLPLVVIDCNLNAQRYRGDILAHHVIPLLHNNANIAIFQHDNAT